MKSKEIQEKIEFLVQKWLDEATLESIVEYASDKLREFYVNLEDAKVVEMYEEGRYEKAINAARGVARREELARRG